MALQREINIKATFMNELHALPRDVLPAATEKIAWLTADPLPDGDLKKKVKGLEGVYRLRIRTWRLFYTFDDKWIRILAIRPRRDAYANIEGLDREEPAALPPPDAPDFIEADAGAGAPAAQGAPPGQVGPAADLTTDRTGARDQVAAAGVGITHPVGGLLHTGIAQGKGRRFLNKRDHTGN